ncbi:hypothetical protein ACFQZC_05755 [Streptacidiphilus monticola]
MALARELARSEGAFAGADGRDGGIGAGDVEEVEQGLPGQAEVLGEAGDAVREDGEAAHGVQREGSGERLVGGPGVDGGDPEAVGVVAQRGD